MKWTPFVSLGILRIALYHSPHYFILESKADDIFYCHDPTYGVSDIKVSLVWLVQNCRELITVAMHPTETVYQQVDSIKMVRQEAGRIIETIHTYTSVYLEKFWSENDSSPLYCAKYADCIISNRLLYKKYLLECLPSLPEAARLFDDSYFLKWRAVKNGYVKAAVTKNQEATLKAVKSYLNELHACELSIAHKINGMVVNHE